MNPTASLHQDSKNLSGKQKSITTQNLAKEGSNSLITLICTQDVMRIPRATVRACTPIYIHFYDCLKHSVTPTSSVQPMPNDSRKLYPKYSEVRIWIRNKNLSVSKFYKIYMLLFYLKSEKALNKTKKHYIPPYPSIMFQS